MHITIISLQAQHLGSPVRNVFFVVDTCHQLDVQPRLLMRSKKSVSYQERCWMSWKHRNIWTVWLVIVSLGGSSGLTSLAW